MFRKCYNRSNYKITFHFSILFSLDNDNTMAQMRWFVRIREVENSLQKIPIQLCWKSRKTSSTYTSRILRNSESKKLEMLPKFSMILFVHMMVLFVDFHRRNTHCSDGNPQKIIIMYSCTRTDSFDTPRKHKHTLKIILCHGFLGILLKKISTICMKKISTIYARLLRVLGMCVLQNVPIFLNR